MAAQPDIDKRTEQLVSKGRWQVPGYKVRGFQLSMSFLAVVRGRCANVIDRRNLETSRCYRDSCTFGCFPPGALG